ncbi:MAG: WG repeat-containing protein [Bacteroidia bacterium]|nr:WG repeat-containing protein [Bacteroidia bacterium]
MKKLLLFMVLLSAFGLQDVYAQKRVGGKMLKGYDVIYPFKNGRAKVIKNGKMGFIDMQGEEIIKPEFDNIMPFEKGVARVEKGLLLGLINEQGEILLDPIYESITAQKDNLFITSRKGKRGLVKITGTTPDDVEYIVDIRD